MATIVRLQVVPYNLDASDPDAYVTRWGVIPFGATYVEEMFDKWVVSQGGDLYDPVPEARVAMIIGPADDFDENHILPDGGLGPKGGL